LRRHTITEIADSPCVLLVDRDQYESRAKRDHMKQRRPPIDIEISPDVDPVAALEALAAVLSDGTLRLDRHHALVAGARLDSTPGESDAAFRRRALQAVGTSWFAIFVTPENASHPRIRISGAPHDRPRRDRQHHRPG
jgi:hypothetical protein